MSDFDFATGYNHTVYTVREIDPSTAEYFGCAGATHIRISRKGTGHALGMLVNESDKLSRVPGWTSARKGYRATFVTYGTFESLSGWIGE